MMMTKKQRILYSLFSIISINEKEKSSQDSNKAKKRLKQIESILSQRIIVLSELKAIAWNGIPFG